MAKRKYEDLPHVKRILKSLKKLAKEKGLEIQDSDFYSKRGHRRIAFYKFEDPTDPTYSFHVVVKLSYLYEEYKTIEKDLYGTIFKIHKTIKKLKPFNK